MMKSAMSIRNLFAIVSIIADRPFEVCATDRASLTQLLDQPGPVEKTELRRSDRAEDASRRGLQ
jgi:hypothetical protein